MKDSNTTNMTHNTESTTVLNLKHEWWGSPLFQEKYQEEKAHDKRQQQQQQQHNNNNNNNNNKLDTEHWYDHVPRSVKTSHEVNVTILWNQQVRIDRTIPNNKPDIIIHDNKKVTCILIDAAIS